jgi:hypothetical protein
MLWKVKATTITGRAAGAAAQLDLKREGLASLNDYSLLGSGASTGEGCVVTSPAIAALLMGGARRSLASAWMAHLNTIPILIITIIIITSHLIRLEARILPAATFRSSP